MSISKVWPEPDKLSLAVKLDTSHLACPLPLLKTKQALCGLASGQWLWLISTQPSLTVDIKALVHQSKDHLLAQTQEGPYLHFLIEKA